MIAGAGFGALIVLLGGTASMLITVVSVIGISVLSIICLSYAFTHRSELADN